MRQSNSSFLAMLAFSPLLALSLPLAFQINASVTQIHYDGYLLPLLFFPAIGLLLFSSAVLGLLSRRAVSARSVWWILPLSFLPGVLSLALGWLVDLSPWVFLVCFFIPFVGVPMHWLINVRS